MQYDHRSDHDERPLPSLREALEPYLTATEAGPYAKLSISVPEQLLATVKEVADETGTSVSGIVAASLRRLVDEVEQARLDAALEADREREPRVGAGGGAAGRQAARGRRVVTGPRRGDVHLVRFEDLGGHVLRGPHPAVVVSSDRLNRADGTVLVCSMTTKARRVAGDWLPPYLVPVEHTDVRPRP